MLGGHPVFDQPRKYSWSLARYIQSSLVSATFHIRRKIKGWAREGEGKFRAVERRRQFKIFVQNSPTELNISAIPFNPYLDGDGFENRPRSQIDSSPQISHRIGRRDSSPNPSPSRKFPPAVSIFPRVETSFVVVRQRGRGGLARVRATRLCLIKACVQGAPWTWPPRRRHGCA